MEGQAPAEVVTWSPLDRLLREEQVLREEQERSRKLRETMDESAQVATTPMPVKVMSGSPQEAAGGMPGKVITWSPLDRLLQEEQESKRLSMDGRKDPDFMAVTPPRVNPSQAKQSIGKEAEAPLHRAASGQAAHDAEFVAVTPPRLNPRSAPYTPLHKSTGQSRAKR